MPYPSPYALSFTLCPILHPMPRPGTWALRLHSPFVSLSFLLCFQFHFLFVFMLYILLLCFSFTLTLLSNIRLFSIVTKYPYLFTTHLSSVYIFRSSSFFVPFALLFHELSNFQYFFFHLSTPLHSRHLLLPIRLRIYNT
jgi:hypothetical protein